MLSVEKLEKKELEKENLSEIRIKNPRNFKNGDLDEYLDVIDFGFLLGLKYSLLFWLLFYSQYWFDNPLHQWL